MIQGTLVPSKKKFCRKFLTGSNLLNTQRNRMDRWKESQKERPRGAEGGRDNETTPTLLGAFTHTLKTFFFFFLCPLELLCLRHR